MGTYDNLDPAEYAAELAAMGAVPDDIRAAVDDLENCADADTWVDIHLTFAPGYSHYVGSVGGQPEGTEWALIVKAVADYAARQGCDPADIVRILTPPRSGAGSGNPLAQVVTLTPKGHL